MSGRYAVDLPIELKKEAEAQAKKQGVLLNKFILWSVAEKVSALKSGLDDPDFPGITYRRGASGIPIPVLRGTGIRVQTIVVSNREWNETPEEIAAQYDLSESLVKEALRFYQAHQVEVDLLIQSDSMLKLHAHCIQCHQQKRSARDIIWMSVPDNREEALPPHLEEKPEMPLTRWNRYRRTRAQKRKALQLLALSGVVRPSTSEPRYTLSPLKVAAIHDRHEHPKLPRNILGTVQGQTPQRPRQAHPAANRLLVTARAWFEQVLQCLRRVQWDIAKSDWHFPSVR